MNTTEAADSLRSAAEPPLTPAEKTGMRVFLGLFCGFFILAGAVILVWSGTGIAQGLLATRWAQTTGTMRSMDNELRSPGGRDRAPSREVVVRYTYRVDGREYQGRRVHPAYGGSSFGEAHASIESALRGAREVRVHYRPGSPEASTLAVGFYSCTLAAFFASFPFLAFGLGLLGMASSAMKADRPRGRRYIRLLVVGVIGGLALAGFFAARGNQDFGAGITVLSRSPVPPEEEW